jgi:eukaryotic-like serine/threonine-protein kinase
VQALTAVTQDGRFALYSDTRPGTGRDIMMAPLDGRGPPTPLLQTTAAELGARPSPDGKWLAYSSNESGRSQVYVRPFGDGETRLQVSRSGGANAKWRGDGRELFFNEGGGHLMSVDVTPGATLDVSAPRLLFTRQAFGDYDVSADGRKFVFVMLDEDAETGTLQAVLNWTALLRR